MKVGQQVELKNDNVNGVGKKGDRGFILYKLYEPVDGWEIMVKLANNVTEAFMEKDLMIAPKTLKLIGGIRV